MKKMTKKEAIQRLFSISEMCQQLLTSGQPLLATSEKKLKAIRDIAQGKEPNNDRLLIKKNQSHIVISCDASITKNPGGKAAVGVVISMPTCTRQKNLEFAKPTKATTNNEAEYDAIYMGLTTLVNLKNNPGCLVEIRSDSRIVVEQVNGKMKCNKPELIKKRDMIRELVGTLPFQVRLTWRPRNSTPELEQANYLAQDYLSVPRH